MTAPLTVGDSVREKWLAKAEGVLKLAGFDDSFFKEIPNEYCGPVGCSICAEHPWLLVATPFGVFKFGWRKRVLVIDWSRTIIATKAAALFAAEDVTKMDRAIHAWGYAKATEYFERLLKAANAKPRIAALARAVEDPTNSEPLRQLLAAIKEAANG